jgi:hypothetical protein
MLEFEIGEVVVGAKDRYKHLPLRWESGQQYHHLDDLGYGHSIVAEALHRCLQAIDLWQYE